MSTCQNEASRPTGSVTHRLPEGVQSFETPGFVTKVLTGLFVVTGVLYLIWRYGTLGDDLPVFSWAIYLAECYGFFSALLHIFMCWKLSVRTASPPAAGLNVDVFIPTYNEPLEVVRRTVLAAKHMDYPHQTWLLDDGNRSEMRQLAERLGIRYLARDNNLHAKAGNLNHALKHSTGDMIAIFDADHAPQKNFLTSTLGYFSDDRVAFVQTPQDFFNLDSYQHRLKRSGSDIWTEQSLFFKIIQRGKDTWNAAFFCGSCAIVRRSALEAVGGFATDTVTEDLHTSLRLHKAGYRSVYHPESLAYGIAPAKVAPFLNQRVRWGQGAMQVLRLENIFFTRKLSLSQKLNYLASMMTYFDGWQKGLFYLAPAFVLLTGVLPIDADGLVFIGWFLPYYLLSVLVFEELGRGYGGILYIEQYNFARFAAFAWATLGYFRRNLRFIVTDKSTIPQQQIFKTFSPQLTVLAVNAIGILVAITLTAHEIYLPLDALLFNLGWAGVNLWIGLAMFRYTRQTQDYLRSEYRFPISLPVQIFQAEGESITVTMNDISSHGCSLGGELPTGILPGDRLRGLVTLPSGQLEVFLRVASLKMTEAEKPTCSAGCTLQFNSLEDEDLLDLFLYGSDLQWRLARLQDQFLTPTKRFSELIKGTLSLPRAKESEWIACDVLSRLDESLLNIKGLIRFSEAGEHSGELITFQPINEHGKISIVAHSSNGPGVVFGPVGRLTRVENRLGPVHFFKIALTNGFETIPMHTMKEVAA